MSVHSTSPPSPPPVDLDDFEGAVDPGSQWSTPDSPQQTAATGLAGPAGAAATTTPAGHSRTAAAGAGTSVTHPPGEQAGEGASPPPPVTSAPPATDPQVTTVAAGLDPTFAGPFASTFGSFNSTKRSATTEPTDPSNSPKRQRLSHYRGTGPLPDHTRDPAATFPLSSDPIIKQTPFAPPYQSIFLRQNPDLERALAHVNCSYLTNHNAADPLDQDSRSNTAPTLAELKAHARSLLLLIRSMSVSSGATLTNNAALPGSTPDGQGPAPLAQDFYSSLDAFDFLNDLASPYRNRDPAENEPLTHLLNQLITRPDLSSKSFVTEEVCPLATVKLISEANEPASFRPGVNPLPHSQINRLMAHADEVLLQIDTALSSSGGLLAALPLDLPDSDARRQTFIGQLIHFMRTLVGRLHVLDRDYGQALGLLAGEATVPAELKLNIEYPEQIEAPMVSAQHKFVLNTPPGTYESIWAHLRDSAGDKAVRKSGMGILDVVVTTRYRALRGGKTIFITPLPKDPSASEVVGRPTVVACAQPGFGTRTSEWERKKGAALREAEGLRMRAEMAEEEVERLRKDVEALVPEGVWANGEKEDVLTMWGKVQAEKDAMADERKQLELFKSRCRVLEQKNSEMSLEVVKEKERLKKRRGAMEEAQREEIAKLMKKVGEMEGFESQVVKLQAELAELKSQTWA
ncbi:hypothetical protein V497_05864 [Pseudogymnoascus sp. VKM F-4516 (FW-969)]|nr:hypothetical protein V497_05864 [Pseudogymnoascus sp. VKM F-4516 (FW-969)]